MKYEVFGTCLIGFSYEIEADSEEEAMEKGIYINEKDIFLGDMSSCEAKEISVSTHIEQAVNKEEEICTKEKT